MNHLRACALLACAALAGCATSWQYLPDAQQRRQVEPPLPQSPEHKATLELTTNTHEWTTFAQRADLCESPAPESEIGLVRARAGFPGGKWFAPRQGRQQALLEARKALLPQTLERQVPAGEPMIWQARSYEDEPYRSMSCGPMFVKFTPQARKHYRLAFHRQDQACLLLLWETDGAQAVAMPEQERWSCARDVLDIGSKPRIVGLRTFKRVDVPSVEATPLPAAPAR